MKDDVGRNALHYCSIGGNIETAKLLLARGSNFEFNLVTKLGADIEARMTNGWTALHAGASVGNKEFCQFLVKNGANGDAKVNRIFSCTYK